MKLAVIVLSAFIVLAGILILIDPNIVYGLIENELHSTELYITAIVFRFLFGLLLFRSASISRNSIFMKILGLIMILAAFIFLMIGPKSFQEFISSALQNLEDYERIGGILGIIIGFYIIYTYTTKKPSITE